MRQERTIDSQKLENELESVQTKQATIREQYTANEAALKKKRSEYDAEVTAFEKALARYNARVADWNRSDRTDDDELDWLRDEEKRLDREQRNLETLRGTVNALVAEVNRYAKENEKVIDRYNAEVETFTETYGTGEAFDQGVYEGTSIDIYQFDDRDHLKMVLVHELGHALGLDHVENPLSIMYPVMGEQDLKNLRLSSEDRAALATVCSVTAWDLLFRDIRSVWSLLST
jgi:predicted Zn-dependent protease